MDKEELERLVEETHREEEDFRSLLPTNGFLGDYMRYTDRQESPGSYHFWVGLTVLGAAMQRNVWISKGIYKVYPNLYTILIGPSGKCRKSRAMSLGLDLLEGYDWANVMADKTTPEALLAALHVGTPTFQKVDNSTGGPTIHINPNLDSCGIAAAYELAVFISKQNYNSGMVGLLTTLYDCPTSFKYLTRNKKPLVLKNVFLSMVGASTPEWLATNLPADSFEGGFMSRVVYVVRQRRDRNIAIPENPDAGETDRLKKHIENVHQAVGEVKFTAAGRAWFDNWYTSTEAIPVTDTSMLGFVERKPDTILKVAMIMAVSVGKDYITDNDLRQAHAIVTWTQERMFSAFAHVDLSPLGVIQKKVLEMLESQGGQLSRGQVLRKLGGRLAHGVKDLIEVEEILIQAGRMEVKQVRHSGPGRPEIRYILKDMTP